jgi:hypothetical protein
VQAHLISNTMEQPTLAALLDTQYPGMVVDSYNVALCVCVCLFAGSTRSALRGHAYIPRRASYIGSFPVHPVFVPTPYYIHL